MISRCCCAIAMLAGLVQVGLAEESKGSSPTGVKIVEETPALPYLTLMLARDPAVHSELGLSRTQVAQVEAAVAAVDEPFWLLRDVPVAECGDKLDALLGQLRFRLQAVLTTAQQDRLDQVVLQARGYKALVSPTIAEDLKLSPEQVAKIRGLLAGPGEQSTGGDAKPATGKLAARTKTTSAESQRILAVLSAEQSGRLSELVGKSFDLGQVRQVGCVAPEIRGVAAWINSDPLTLESLRGKVVAVHFWAFGCVNCVHNLPHYQSWYEKFPKSQLTIIGLHTPETEGERSVENLGGNIRERKIAYPVAFDAAAENWKAWGNHMWPSVYLIDKQGRVRYWWYGELNWEGARGEEFMRKKIEELLAEK